MRWERCGSALAGWRAEHESGALSVVAHHIQSVCLHSTHTEAHMAAAPTSNVAANNATIVNVLCKRYAEKRVADSWFWWGLIALANLPLQRLQIRRTQLCRVALLWRGLAHAHAHTPVSSLRACANRNSNACSTHAGSTPTEQAADSPCLSSVHCPRPPRGPPQCSKLVGVDDHSKLSRGAKSLKQSFGASSNLQSS
jgi:hypothetical protein